MERDEEDWLHAWGVPADLYPFSGWPIESIGPGPVFTIDGERRPTERQIVTAAELGMTVVVNADGPFDLSVLTRAAGSIKALACYGEPSHYRSLTILREMTSLETLVAPWTDEPVDLGSLTRLTRAVIGGSGLLSLTTIPALRHLSVSVKSFDRVRVGAHIESLAIECKSPIALDALADAQQLDELVIRGASSVDLSRLRGLPQLRRLVFIRCRTIVGTASLLTLQQLRELDFAYVAEIEDAALVSELNLRRFESLGNRVFDDNFARQVAGRPGHWYIDRPIQRREELAKSSPFVVQLLIDGRATVAFSDWSWLREQLGDQEALLPETSAEVETMMRLALEPRERLDFGVHEMQFDSEGEAAILILESEGEAQKVVSALNKVFLDPARLRRIAAQAVKPG